MERQSCLLKLLLVAALLTVLAAPAWAQMAPPPPPPGVAVPPPMPPGAAPAWTVVPTAPQVQYAPNINGDLFRLHKRYYYHHGGVWYRSKHWGGPWHPVRKPPRALYRVNRTYFKTPPPW